MAKNSIKVNSQLINKLLSLLTASYLGPLFVIVSHECREINVSNFMEIHPIIVDIPVTNRLTVPSLEQSSQHSEFAFKRIFEGT